LAHKQLQESWLLLYLCGSIGQVTKYGGTAPGFFQIGNGAFLGGDFSLKGLPERTWD
jgi:hypothetical protein